MDEEITSVREIKGLAQSSAFTKRENQSLEAEWLPSGLLLSLPLCKAFPIVEMCSLERAAVGTQ